MYFIIVCIMGEFLNIWHNLEDTFLLFDNMPLYIVIETLLLSTTVLHCDNILVLFFKFERAAGLLSWHSDLHKSKMT